MKVAVTGSSGLVGTALCRAMQRDGHEVLRLVRRKPKAADELRWDPDWSEIDGRTLEGLDAFVHLAGDNLASGRWTESKKLRLRTSRVGPTRLLSEALAGLARKPDVFVSASAIGYYGDNGDEWLNENSAPGEDFLARLVVDWEEATEPAVCAGIRVVTLRSGIVLSAEGGALARMLPAFRAGVGGVLGRGTQYMSWIAIDDLVAVILHAISTSGLSGPVNAVSPSPVTNAQFTRALGRALGRPTFASAPAFALRIAFGEMADAALLASQRVRPDKLAVSGFDFAYPELDAALQHLVPRKKKRLARATA